MEYPNYTCTECQFEVETLSALLSHDVNVHGYCSEPGCQTYFGTYAQLQQHRQVTPMHFFCPGPAGLLCDPNHSYRSANRLQAHRESAAHVDPVERCVWNCCEDKKFISIAALAAHYDANACPPMSRLELNRHVFDADTEREPGRQPQLLVVDDEQLPADEGYIVERIMASLEWAEGTGLFTCLHKYCLVTFTSRQKLVAHMRGPIHDPYIYRCRTCLRRFQALSGLAGHVASGACGVNSAVVGLEIKGLMRVACLRRREELHN